MLLHVFSSDISTIDVKVNVQEGYRIISRLSRSNCQELLEVFNGNNQNIMNTSEEACEGYQVLKQLDNEELNRITTGLLKRNNLFNKKKEERKEKKQKRREKKKNKFKRSASI